MPNEERWKEVVKKLTEQTEAGQVNWQQGSPFAIPIVRETGIKDMYCAVVQGRWLLVYEYTYRDFGSASDFGSVSESTDETEVSIEFVDQEGKIQWRWPKLDGRWQLIEAIRYRLSGAHSFLESFLPPAKKPV